MDRIARLGAARTEATWCRSISVIGERLRHQGRGAGTGNPVEKGSSVWFHAGVPAHMSRCLGAKISSCCPSMEDIRGLLSYLMICFSVDHCKSTSSIPECNSLFAVRRLGWPLGRSPAAVWAFTRKGWSFNKRHEVVATSPLVPKSPIPPPPGRSVSPPLCGRTWCDPLRLG